MLGPNLMNLSYVAQLLVLEPPIQCKRLRKNLNRGFKFKLVAKVGSNSLISVPDFVSPQI